MTGKLGTIHFTDQKPVFTTLKHYFGLIYDHAQVEIFWEQIFLQTFRDVLGLSSREKVL